MLSPHLVSTARVATRSERGGKWWRRLTQRYRASYLRESANEPPPPAARRPPTGPMELYLLRHGDAVDRATGGYKRDEDRPLTDEGEEEVRQAAGALLKLGVALALVLTSPLVRARQTADLVADALEPKRGIEVRQALAPGGRPEAILRAVAGVGPVE